MQRAVLIATAVLLSTACWPARPSSAELVGKWEVDHGYGLETLVLSEDGAYHQTLVETGGRVIENRGRWQIRLSSEALAGSKVILRDALIFETPLGKREPNPARQDWELEAVHEWGRTRLIFNPDAPGFHKK